MHDSVQLLHASMLSLQDCIKLELCGRGGFVWRRAPL